MAYTVTATSTSPFIRSNIKGDGSYFWTNQGAPVAPQNFEFDMVSQEITINNSLTAGGTSTLSARVIVSVVTAGNTDATSTLNLDNILA